ncbi:MAG: MFS transporter [Candidatus Binatia bacterium]
MTKASRGGGLLATTRGKSLLFGALYLSEGAPIGYLWVALPTSLRASGVPLAEVTALAALLVVPWTCKFAWAPLVDLLTRRGIALHHVIVSAQALMGLTLLSLLVLDPLQDYALLRAFLLAHAFAAATQDVAIDAWCIRTAAPAERARLNGWMQVGMLSGRSLLGGGALVLAPLVGTPVVVALLIGVTTFSGALVLASPSPRAAAAAAATPPVGRMLRDALGRRTTWAGLLFALLAGAGPRALEVVCGPFLVDRGYASDEVGWLLAGPFIFATILGAVLGGWIGDRASRTRVVGATLACVAVGVAMVALLDARFGERAGAHLLLPIAATFFANGVFTAVSYALFMDLAAAGASATLFSAFMGATNGCEAWAVYALGRLEPTRGYSGALIALSAASVLALLLVPLLRTSPAGSSNRKRRG